MHNAKSYLPIFAAMLCMFLIIVAALFCSLSEPLEQIHFQDQIHGQEIIPFYDEEESIYYLFLPSYTGPNHVSVKAEWGSEIRLTDGRSLTSLEMLSADETGSITVRQFLTEKNYRLQVQQSRNAVSLLIDMQPGGLERLHDSKENRENAFVQFLDTDGSLMYQDLAVMSGRGNGTWDNQEKRPFNLSFSSLVSIGPMDGISNLCLIAEYSDESKMRNALAYYSGAKMEIPYTSDYLYADIYINGAYHGLYGICTKQEYEKHIITDGIQAVFEIASSESLREFVAENSGRTIGVCYGNLEQIRQQVNRLEKALEERDWYTCEKLLNFGSFARKYVLDEFIGNLDMGYASQYFYLDQDGKISSMLPWDYDWSIGSAMTFFNKDHAYGLMTRRFTRYWATILLEYEPFCIEVQRVIREELTDDFLDDLQEYAWNLNDSIDASRACDMLRWKNHRPFNQDHYQSGYREMTELIRFFCSYFTARRNHLLSYFSAPNEYCFVEFRGTYNYYFNYLVPREALLSDYLQDREKLYGEYDGFQILGWYTESGEPLDAVEYVTEDIQLHTDRVELEPYFEPEDPEGESLTEKIGNFGVQLIIIGLFVLSALLLFVTEMKRILKNRWVYE